MPGKVVSREEWLSARKEFLVKEKATTRALDALSKERRELPIVKLDKTYTFEGPSGKVSLSDLFGDGKQLLVYHFMLGPDSEVGCEGCSYMADNLPSELAHLRMKNTALVMVSRAPLTNIEQFKKRMGWTLPWYSSHGSDFNYDFHATLDKEVAPPVYNFKDVPNSKGDMPGLSVFYKDDGGVYHSYSTYARGLDGIMSMNALLDLTPLGRQDVPGMDDIKLHDEYEFEKGKA